MIRVDGSFGEGGGQILRTSVALSSLTKKPVVVENIRANRSNPGLRPQHLMAIKCMKNICDARVEGLEIGSSSISFYPGDDCGGDFSFDIGTAGSITLVFQTCILGSVLCDKPVKLRLTGGTDVKWSPPWDYFEKVFLRLIRKTGVSVHASLIKRGYYPRGGGEAEIVIKPVRGLHPLCLDDSYEFKKVFGVIHSSSLPGHVSKRIKHSAVKFLLKNNLRASIDSYQVDSFSPGVGVTLWVENKDCVLGSSFLGEKGVKAEMVGERAAKTLLDEIRSDGTVDTYACDQILPYLALAAEKNVSCFRVKEISGHAETNMWLIKKFLPVDFKFDKGKKPVQVVVQKT